MSNLTIHGAPPPPARSTRTDVVPYVPRYVPEPASARWALRAMAITLAVLIGWSAVAKIDQTTHAPAQLIVPERTQFIQSADGGIVTELHVKEGDRVKAGQILATMQKERAAAAVADGEAKVAALRIALARLRAEGYGSTLEIPAELLRYKDYVRNQTELYNKRQKAYRDDINAMESILVLAETEFNINQKLEATGDVARSEILRLERSVAEIRAQLLNKRNKYFQDALAEMTKAQEELTTQIELLRDRNQTLEHTELVAPFDGIVNNIKVNTVGGVVRPGDTIMELLVSSDKYVAEAKVSPTDISSVSQGQDASVKLDAYDSSIYGGMHGQVIYVSPDVLTEETRNGTNMYYRVRIEFTAREFEGAHAKEIRLRPGLTATVDIRGKERTVLSYLTKPITKTLRDSLTER